MKDELHIFWTNADLITSEKMMFMYARNALLNRWWKKVTVIIWGDTEKLAAENKIIQGRIEESQIAGVQFTACIACADQLGVTEKLRDLGIEVKPWGKLLTDLIKEGKPLLTV